MHAQNVIDPATFQDLKELMGADFISELVDSYCLETEALIKELRRAFSNQEAATVGRIAHSIKSSSASLGALAFSQQARQLEMTGKAGDLSDAALILEILEAGFVQVKRRLEELKDEP
jgi:HPt (histidine-containing phosphotransfer) domain-containing protein